MRNLFFKVFALILCSAVGLFALVATLFHFFDSQDRFDTSYELAYQLARDAVGGYEEKGLDGLIREQEKLFRRLGIRGYLMYGDGRAIGRELPRFARNRITKFPQSVPQVKTPRGEQAIHAVTVTTDDNQSYRFVIVENSRGNRRWLFRHPGARIFVSLLIIALASLFISILITRPLGGLKSATQKFSGGNLQSRAPVKITRRNDAFGELAREFNQMGSRIESLIAEHQRLLRDVSHELRSPLSRMQVAATLLEDKVGEDSASQAQVARIQSEILRLDTLIGQLLSLARLQAGSTVLDMEEVSLKNLLRKVAQDATYEFSEKGKNVDVHGDEAIIQADADTLRSTFENVIRNGLRYTRSTLQVSLGSLLPNTARIEIVDDGPGVPDEELESIFEPFYRPDQSRSETTGSTGLGLAIAKGIVEAHGGEISAANATNGGLVVTIDLPAA